MEHMWFIYHLCYVLKIIIHFKMKKTNVFKRIMNKIWSLINQKIEVFHWSELIKFTQDIDDLMLNY
jgi:hypothetical protein